MQSVMNLAPNAKIQSEAFAVAYEKTKPFIGYLDAGGYGNDDMENQNLEMMRIFLSIMVMDILE